MKRRMIGVVFALCVIVALSSVLTSGATADNSHPAKNAGQTASADASKVQAARFLNMLNHNYVYGTDFQNADDMVNDSLPALLGDRDPQNPNFIAEQYVADFVSSMYGIQLADTSALNPGYPQRDGYIYIIPRGYTGYAHSFVSAVQNEDGSWTVTTKVRVTPHDGTAFTCRASTLFVKNDASAFGYNIISSELSTDSAAL